MEFSVRTANIDDVGYLAKMNLNLYAEGEHQREKTLPQLEERFRYYINDSRWNINIVLLEGADNGYILWRFEDDDVYVRHFWLNSDYRGSGLSANVLDWLNDKYWNNKRIRIQMFASNEKMRSFWKVQGFKERSVIMERG